MPIFEIPDIRPLTVACSFAWKKYLGPEMNGLRPCKGLDNCVKLTIDRVITTCRKIKNDFETKLSVFF